MSKAVDKAVAHRDMRVSRAKAKTVDVGAWKSHKESWKEKRNTYIDEWHKLLDKKIRISPHEFNYDSDYIDAIKEIQRKIDLMKNDIEICRLQIAVCNNQIKIAKLIQENTKLKTNLM